jgi:hypothetical protein
MRVLWWLIANINALGVHAAGVAAVAMASAGRGAVLSPERSPPASIDGAAGAASTPA